MVVNTQGVWRLLEGLRKPTTEIPLEGRGTQNRKSFVSSLNPDILTSLEMFLFSERILFVTEIPRRPLMAT